MGTVYRAVLDCSKNLCGAIPDTGPEVSGV
jgi:hypothetical protein